MSARETTSAKILAIFKNSALGLTDDDLGRHLEGVKKSSIKAIRCRFLKSGDLYCDGTTRPGVSGRLLKVYRHTSFTRQAENRLKVEDKRRARKGPEPSRSDKIRDAIAGLLAIIQLIEIQLPKRTRKSRK